MLCHRGWKYYHLSFGLYFLPGLPQLEFVLHNKPYEQDAHYTRQYGIANQPSLSESRCILCHIQPEAPVDNTQGDENPAVPDMDVSPGCFSLLFQEEAMVDVSEDGLQE